LCSLLLEVRVTVERHASNARFIWLLNCLCHRNLAINFPTPCFTTRRLLKHFRQETFLTTYIHRKATPKCINVGTQYLFSPYGPYSLYRVSVPIQGCILLYFILHDISVNCNCVATRWH
jgi:hypothetical protein